MKRERYTTIFSQTLSHDARYLAAGDGFGNIAVFCVSSLRRRASCAESAADDNSDDENGATAPAHGDDDDQNAVDASVDGHGAGRPAVRFNCGSDAPVYSLHSDERHLLALSDNTLCAYRWSDVTAAAAAASVLTPDEQQQQSSSPPLAWSIDLVGARSDLYGGGGGNYAAAAADVSGGRLWAAVGRSVVVHDLETRRCLHVLEGHTDSVLNVRCVRARAADAEVSHSASDQCVSCGEDGSVRQWDCRQATARQMTASLVPADQYGGRLGHAAGKARWLSALDVSGEWLVCGGAVAPAVYHRRSGALSAVLAGGGDTACTVARFVAAAADDGMVATGGSESCVRLFNMATGAAEAVIDTSCSAVFSLLSCQLPSGADSAGDEQLAQPAGLMTVAGCSPLIDVCADNHRYRDFSVSFV